MTETKAIKNYMKTKKQTSKFKQQTNNKIFLIRLKIALKKASNTLLHETAILVNDEMQRRKDKK